MIIKTDAASIQVGEREALRRPRRALALLERAAALLQLELA